MWRKRPSKAAANSAAAASSLPHLLPAGDLPSTLEAHGNLYTPHGHFVQPSATRVSTPADDTFRPLGNVMVFETGTQAPSKKEKQFMRWDAEVLPALMAPYVKLLRETESLRNMAEVRLRRGCEGCSEGKSLKVSCIFFESR